MEAPPTLINMPILYLYIYVYVCMYVCMYIRTTQTLSFFETTFAKLKHVIE